jgi:hypothetical protein
MHIFHFFQQLPKMTLEVSILKEYHECKKIDTRALWIPSHIEGAP